MVRAQEDATLKPALIRRDTMEQSRRNASDQDVYRPVDDANPTARIGLPDIVQQRRPQKIGVSVTGIDQ
jgi:hypothetical protein